MAPFGRFYPFYSCWPSLELHWGAIFPGDRTKIRDTRGSDGVLLMLAYAGYLLILRRLVEILWSQLHHVNVDSLFFVLWVLLRNCVFLAFTHSRIPVV